jgi:hypothetical protein
MEIYPSTRVDYNSIRNRDPACCAYSVSIYGPEQRSSPSGCSGNRECITPIRTLHECCRMMTFGHDLQMCLGRGFVKFGYDPLLWVSHFVSEILDSERLDMHFCGLLSVANV